jgi:selenoprotein W-related protein
LAEDILDEYADALPGGVTIEPGSGGVFEIYYNDTPVFSKKQEGRFPEPGEVQHMLMHALERQTPNPGPLAGGALDNEEMSP